MTEALAPRSRKVKILATLGPATSSPAMIRKLMLAGADAFRINMSHGDQKQKAKLVENIRALEREFHRPTTILFDLQGPKLRVGHFDGGRAVLAKGQRFIFDRDETAGDDKRVQLPHTELFEAVRPGTNILIDDGKVRLAVLEAGPDRILTEVRVGGAVSDNKGVNVPDVVVPIPALTDKDRDDLQFALEQRTDWIALSFVQRPEDVAEARSLIGERAALLAKIEKDRRGPPEFFLERADRLDQLRFLLLVAMAHVDAEGVRAGEHQLADRADVARRWPQRRQDLHLARTGREGRGHIFAGHVRPSP